MVEEVDMIEKVIKDFIGRHGLIETGDRIVVAVSGGPDSLALLHFLHVNRKEWGAEVMAAHLDHMFRGEESYRELLFVKQFCEEQSIGFHGERIDVPRIMEAESGSLQEIARKVRYDYLRGIMKEVSADKLALGHHGDDQMETILMKLTRGSAGMGRAGIPYTRDFPPGEIIRPFLPITKKEIEEYCEEHGLSPRRDPSNDKDDYTRNRFRRVVIPFLKRENPLAHLQFQQFSEEISEDEQYLEELTRQKLNTVWNNTEVFSALDIKGFLAMAEPLQRRGINLILNYLYKLRPSSLATIHIYDVLGILRGKSPNASLDLPGGLRVTRAYDTCYFHFGELATGQAPYCYQLKDDQPLTLPSGSQFVLHDSLKDIDGSSSDCVYLNREDIALPLYIRTRKAGDRLKIKGLQGTKKLKSLFIDEKIPRHLREEWPIVTDSKDEILWVPGIKKSIYDLGEAGVNGLVVQFKSNHLLGGS
ncbi:tRNA lysidine(34) synthetase TilS [Rossellomorea aquimaris]|uniref:tRNA lysidine(34) synthetase TilS n=1 Tax=Rossellomorea aquimaris TaxID=189382 RepID=UPI001CD2D688|nr:tRNA lysidine(34) synthetase TilS [Rossellomorea aquimaris]MCA1057277.1 tRNA lysidine(34) synthetase TilS [Rossellomorea aquimaris]